MILYPTSLRHHQKCGKLNSYINSCIYIRCIFPFMFAFKMCDVQFFITRQTLSRRKRGIKFISTALCVMGSPIAKISIDCLIDILQRTRASYGVPFGTT